MIQAVLEIATMLLVALAIGVFFTRRYWMSKYDEVNEANKVLKTSLAKSESELDRLKKEMTSLKSDHQVELDKLKKELSDQQSEFEKEKAKLVEGHNQAIEKGKKKIDAVEKKEVKHKKKQEELSNIIELKEELLGEKEREIDELSKHLVTHKISYYKQIDGKRYKAITLREADESVAGLGDGRISKADAEKVFATISDGHTYTQVEKDTMHYIRENYKWTPEADELFRAKVRSWAAKGHQFE